MEVEMNHSYDESATVKIAVINSGIFPAVYILSGVVKQQLLDSDGDYDESLIIDLFNRKFDTELRLSEISWGEVEQIQIN